jgi:AraC-like DNA-binding protein
MALSVVLCANSPQNSETFSDYRNFPPQQLFDSAEYYFSNNCNDTALIYYMLFMSVAPIKDFEQQKRMVEALNKTAVIYYYMSDYRSSYDFLIKALSLCEKVNYVSYLPKIYTNIGNVYYRFNKYDMAKSYYSKALNFPQDSTSMIVLLNNLGAVELEVLNFDSAEYFIIKALRISERHGYFLIPSIVNNIASYFQEVQLYDSALYYYHLSLGIATEYDQFEDRVENLSNLGRLFFEVNKPDSALFYIELSNTFAKEHNFLRILAENYLTLSKIERAKGRTTKSFEYFEKYANLKDSILNVEKFGDIHQLQRLYEVSKTNQQIEKLTVEQQIKERTIYYQKIIQYITLGALLLLSAITLLILLQKRKLNTAYKALFEKNLKIIDLQKKSPEKNQERKSALTDDMQDELMDKILTIMEDTSVICDTAFSINKLAAMVQSNHTYVSQVINNILKKNFRSFLNSYRIEEAQRLFSEPDAARYTIEAVSFQVGFRSRSAFRDAFKEITGVSPNFYLKSMRGKK